MSTTGHGKGAYTARRFKRQADKRGRGRLQSEIKKVVLKGKSGKLSADQEIKILSGEEKTGGEESRLSQ